MSDLLGALAARNQRIAQPRAAGYAAANRIFEITITRPGVEPTFNRTAREFVAAPQPLVYAGSARIHPVSPGQSIDLGDGPSYWDTVEISIGLGVLLAPRIDDLAVIGDNQVAEVARVVGKAFRVTGIPVGGHLATGFVLVCTGSAASRFTPNEQ